MVKNALPDQRTLRKWYETVECESGFSKEVLKTLKKQSKNRSKKLLCSLMMDKMSIRKHVHWDSNKYVGHVDYGNSNIAPLLQYCPN